jgi:putative lipoprotein
MRPGAARVGLRGALLLGAGVGLAACAGAPEEAAPPRPEPVYQAWRCADGTRLATAFGEVGAALRLRIGETRWRLPPERTASGAAWAGEGVRFWNRGEEALLERDAERTRCTVDRVGGAELEAAARGVRLRALGNEPGWVLELAPGGVRWVTDYGTRSLRFGPPERSEDPAASQHWWTAAPVDGDGAPLRVAVAPGPCHDAAGRPFPLTVTVHHEGRRHPGCGRSLTPERLP